MLRTTISPSICKITEFSSSNTCYSLSMAKNESEACVISLYSENGYSDLRLCYENKEDGIKVEFEKECTINVEGTDYPDPLLPINGSFDLEADKVTNILVRFTTYPSTDSGNHEFKIYLKNDDDIIADYTVVLKVWNFALPEARTIETSVGITYDGIAYHYGYSSVRSSSPECPLKIDIPAENREKNDEMYKVYYDYLLDRKICGYYLPYDILDDRADAYMSDPRVTTFKLIDDIDDDRLSKCYEKLSSNPVWMKKAYLYPLDEPTTVEHLDEIKKRLSRLHRLCPGIRCTSPFYWNAEYNENTDEVQVLLDNLDLMCPKITSWNDAYIYRFPGQKERHGSFFDRMKKAKEQGKQIWQYVCWEPGRPYVNLYVNESGLDHRLLFWMQHKIGATGFLYWRANFWKDVDDPWTSMATVPGLSKDVYGDGSLLYPGDKVGLEGPCGSVRLEIVKDGLEDCEMLRIADEVLGREWVESKIAEIVQSVTSYTESPELFLAVRNEIGDALDRAFSNV